MTQEDKDLLIKDLCARLPYGVRVQGNFKWGFDGQIMDDMRESVLDIETLEWSMNGIEVRPYLRPMSSMTEEEREYYNNHLSGIITGIDAANFMIWIYSNHLDIFHLIEKGLAIEVTEENNPYKE